MIKAKNMRSLAIEEAPKGVGESPREYLNEVLLQGRISSLLTEKSLPSGDVVLEMRIVVERPRRKQSAKSVAGGEEPGVDSKRARREVDSIDLAMWSPKSQRQARKLAVGDWVQCKGAIRRRFWRSANGLASRWQIEVADIRTF
jgi:single-strand DNA-binding protein